MKKPKVKQKIRGINPHKFLLFFILLFAAFLRFYKLAELFHWTLDEEYWSYVPFNIAKGYHFPLIGGPVSGTGLYLGPLFVWIMSIPFFLVNGNPLGIAFLVSLLGVFTTYCVYRIGKHMFNHKTAEISSIIYAVSFLVVLYDRKYWNATPIPLFSLLIIYCIWKIIKGRYKWSILLSIILAVAFHSHMTSAVLIIFIVVSWIVFKLSIIKKEVIFSIILFIILQTPLYLFELRHDFLNTKALVNFIDQEKSTNSVIESAADVSKLFINTTSRLIYMSPNLNLSDEMTVCKQYAQNRYLPPSIFSLVFLSSLFFLISNKKSQNNKLLLIIIGTNLICLFWFRLNAQEHSWYSGQVNEYYLFPSFPAIILTIGFTLEQLMNKSKKINFILGSLLALFASINIYAFVSANHSDGYIKKLFAVENVIGNIKDEPFSLTVKSQDPCQIYGYRYLFTYQSIEPQKSYVDHILGWLYEERITNQKITKNVQIDLDTENILLEDIESPD